MERCGETSEQDEEKSCAFAGWRNTIRTETWTRKTAMSPTKNAFPATNADITRHHYSGAPTPRHRRRRAKTEGTMYVLAEASLCNITSSFK